MKGSRKSKRKQGLNPTSLYAILHRQEVQKLGGLYASYVKKGGGDAGCGGAGANGNGAGLGYNSGDEFEFSGGAGADASGAGDGGVGRDEDGDGAARLLTLEELEAMLQVPGAYTAACLSRVVGSWVHPSIHSCIHLHPPLCVGFSVFSVFSVFLVFFCVSCIFLCFLYFSVFSFCFSCFFCVLCVLCSVFCVLCSVVCVLCSVFCVLCSVFCALSYSNKSHAACRMPHTEAAFSHPETPTRRHANMPTCQYA